MVAIPAAPLTSTERTDQHNRLTWRNWAIVLIPALILRGIVLLSGLTVSFNSDEAIVALMARHINQGQPIPTFFYGQPYLGSLDAILVSIGFRIFGESVASIRLIESILYLLIVITTVLLAWRLASRSTHRRRIAVIAGLLIAIPPVMFTLYTTMTLGGYGETLLFGNLIWLIGWDIVEKPDGRGWRWIALGIVAGLAWWTDALIISYLIPIGLFLLITVIKRRKFSDLGGIVLAGVAFLIGGAPWWIDNLQHNWEGLHWLLDNSQAQGFGRLFGIQTREIGLLFFNFPAAIGVRYSWTPDWWAGSFGGLIVAIAVLVLIVTGRRALRQFGAERFVLISLLILSLLTLFSSSGVDSSGRYFLPAVVMFALLIAFAADLIEATVHRPLVWQAIVGGWLIFQIIGLGIALSNVPPGLTSQFDAITDFTNQYDQQAIAFLESHTESEALADDRSVNTLGFGTYWVTFRLAFLSHENVILDAWLPYKALLSYTPADRRYAPYTYMAASASHPVYVTANNPPLDEALQKAFARLNIHYSEQSIGPYRIYYDLSKRVTPDLLLPLPGQYPYPPGP